VTGRTRVRVLALRVHTRVIGFAFGGADSRRLHLKRPALERDAGRFVIRALERLTRVPVSLSDPDVGGAAVRLRRILALLASLSSTPAGSRRLRCTGAGG
jgi:hypothetical protein